MELGMIHLSFVRRYISVTVFFSCVSGEVEHLLHGLGALLEQTLR